MKISFFPKLDLSFFKMISFIFFLSLFAISIANFIPFLGAITIVILLGMISENIFHFSNDKFSPTLSFLEKKILPLAIALMGFKLDFHIMVQLGPKILFFITLMVLGTLFFTYLLGKFFHYSFNQTFLIGSGSAICGSAAIIGVSNPLKADKKDIGLSLSIINLMGTLGLLVFPQLVQFFGLSDMSSSLLIGGTLQSVGHVVGAGHGVSQDVGELSLLIKMGRILFLGPIIIFLSIYIQKKGNSKNSTSIIKSIPSFIIFFFAFAIFNFFIPLDETITSGISKLSYFLLLLAMSSVGLKIKFYDLIKQGPKLALFAGLIFIFQISFAIIGGYLW